MNLLWSSEKPWIGLEKSSEKPPLNKFRLKTYLFDVLYPNMGNLNFHIFEDIDIFQKKKKKFFSQIP